jgi:hypothetical protein
MRNLFRYLVLLCLLVVAAGSTAGSPRKSGFAPSSQYDHLVGNGIKDLFLSL